MCPTFELEAEHWGRGRRYVAGLDEAGRGAWAGPLVAAAVVLPDQPVACAGLLRWVRDSKQLAPDQRALAYDEVVAVARAIGLAVIPVELIDAIGVGQANRLALRLAAENLGVRPDYCLVDYFKVPRLALPQEGIVRGDATCLSIAAASIVAKCTRDRIMIELDSHRPGFGFANHKGYGTAEHRAALAELGVGPDHRRSFAPIHALVAT
ncbi:MAG: ribonuclease HII [Chloroflexi bacterium]|nr:ribonuclease HII [Chloroflexota bacterium]